MPPAARLTDFHMCPMATPGTPPIPHVGGPILPACSTNVFTGKLPQARVFDKAMCTASPPDVIMKGSMGVFVNNLPAARIGDMTMHGGAIMKGEFTVMIGEIGVASPSVGAFQMVGPLEPPMAADAGGNPDVPAVVKTMIAAGEKGAPFCEQCQKG